LEAAKGELISFFENICFRVKVRKFPGLLRESKDIKGGLIEKDIFLVGAWVVVAVISVAAFQFGWPDWIKWSTFWISLISLLVAGGIAFRDLLRN
jgi:hypothetical protein